jgi:hypothetical protein
MRTVDHAAFAVNFSRRVLKIDSPFKKAGFVIGNLLPDFSYHTYCKGIGHGFSTARKKLVLAWQSKRRHGETVGFYFRLGVAAHYLCDSFTYPHNVQFCGTLAGHVRYENVMHSVFGRAGKLCSDAVPVFETPESCMEYLEKRHRRYVLQPEKSPRADLGWIVKSCKTALLSSLNIPRNYSINVEKILRRGSFGKDI